MHASLGRPVLGRRCLIIPSHFRSVDLMYCDVHSPENNGLFAAGRQAERGSASTRLFGRVYVACDEPCLAHLRIVIRGISLIAMAFPANS